MPAEANLEFSVGETWTIKATMHDSCGNVLPIPSAQVKWRLALDGEDVTTLTVGDGITITDADEGQATIKLTPAQQVTLEITPNFFQHECQVILVDGTVTDQFAGVLQATPSLFAT